MLVMAVMALSGCSEDQTALQINYENTGIVKGKVVFVEESGRESRCWCYCICRYSL